ncbi:hypothetical protein ACFQVA_19130 [Actinomadura keratinilytica]
MRWLVGWSSASTGLRPRQAAPGPPPPAHATTPDGTGLGYGAYAPEPGAGPFGAGAESVGIDDEDGGLLTPVGARLLWDGPDPLWAVGDWRPDEIRVVRADADTRIAVLGTCAATDEQLRVGLFAARGGALRHLTAWPGSYTAVVQAVRAPPSSATSPAHAPSSTPPGRTAPPTRPPPSRSPTSSAPRSTSATSPRCWPCPTCPRPSTTPPRSSASTASRRATP